MFLIFLFFQTFAYATMEPSLREKMEVILTPRVDTQDGSMAFVGNHGVFATEGANYSKVFGKGRPTTLWSHNRRVKCYEQAIRVSVQMPIVDAHTIAVRRWQSIMVSTSSTSKILKKATDALNSLKTGYIKEYDKTDRLRNDLSQFLRKYNPKSKQGVQIRTTNLKKVSYAHIAVDWIATFGNYMIGAVLEQALACDAALDRLDEIRNGLSYLKMKGKPVDDAWFEALDRAESNLSRSEAYYGALIVTLNDHKKEIFSKGVTTAYPLIMKKVFHANMARYVKLFLKHQHKNWTGAKIKSVAGGAAALWTWSILATYYTIDGLLNQHERAQISVAAATLDELMHQSINISGSVSSRSVEEMILQNQYTYFHKMEKVSSGFLAGFHNFVSTILMKEGKFSEAKDYFKQKKEDMEQIILQSTGRMSHSPSVSGPVPGGRSILIILDTSASMTEYLPNTHEKKISSAKKAILQMLDTTARPVEWALMIYGGCRPKVVVNFTQEDAGIRKALAGIKVGGRTPLAASLTLAGRYLETGGRYITCDVILLSDGKDTCGGDPVKAAANLYGQSVDFTQWMK